VPLAGRERCAERVRPRQHGRPAGEQHQRRCRITEVLDPEPDAVRFDRLMHVDLQAALWTDGARAAVRSYVVTKPEPVSHRMPGGCPRS
jgi:hypothetical protein